MTMDISLEYSKLSLEKASELGKTLSRGGIALADNQTAFVKRFGLR